MKIRKYRNMGEFISFLDGRGELHRVKSPVSADLEITEITDRVVKDSGPALLFEDVKGSPYPLVTNLMGTDKRMAWALRRNPRHPYGTDPAFRLYGHSRRVGRQAGTSHGSR